MNIGYQFVLLGTGDPQLELKFKEYLENPAFKSNYSANITFSEELARRIYAATDMFLVPSRYEPCGLTQMIAMKYGSVPIVRATGGLYDTVENEETGFVFEDFTQAAMLEAVKNAFITYSTNKTKWNTIIKNAMLKDYSWTQSAKKYVMLYNRAVNN